MVNNMDTYFVKLATPEFIAKLLNAVGMGETAPAAEEAKPAPVNPLEDVGVGAGIGGLAGAGTAAVPGGMAMMQESRLSHIPKEEAVTRDAGQGALMELFKGQQGKVDEKQRVLMMKSILEDTQNKIHGLADETSSLKKSIPAMIKYRNVALKLGIPIGLGAGALAGYGYNQSR